MAIFASDTFNRTDENLGVSGASGGGTWAKVSFAGGIPSITSNRIRSNSANVNIYRHSASPASADYSVKADIYCNDVATQTRIGPAVRVDDFGNCYNAYYLKSGNRFEMRKETGGTASVQPTSAVIGNSAVNSHTAVNGQTYSVELIIAGDQLSLKVDGAQVIAPFTDTSISAAGRPGLRASVSNTNFLLDNWEAIETTGGPSIPVIMNQYRQRNA